MLLFEVQSYAGFEHAAHGITLRAGGLVHTAFSLPP